MQRFTMYRKAVPTDTHDENQRNAPEEPQFEGVVFTDGRVAVRWMTAKRSTSCWDSISDMLAIHGHPEYGSVLVWHDVGPCAYCVSDNQAIRETYFNASCPGCDARMGAGSARNPS